MKDHSRLVYSSEQGRICPDCGKVRSACVCRQEHAPPGDGIVRVRRESKGRGGKTVTVVTGLPLDAERLKALAGELKRRCGSGGTIRDWAVEIQGDHAETVVSDLQKRGYAVKRVGG